MLWWGTMVVTGVGWFLVGQVVFVVAVVGLGGQALLVSLSLAPLNVPPHRILTVHQAALRFLHIVPRPPAPEPARPPQPEPLTHRELDRIPVVCFAPHPDPPSSPGTPTESKSRADAQAQPSTPVRKWCRMRFQYPPHYLKPDKAMCVICQENFKEPEVVQRLLYVSEPLRLLACGHVYHVSPPPITCSGRS